MAGQGLSSDLIDKFKQTLQSSDTPPETRALLARSEGNQIALVSTFNAQNTDKEDFQICLKELLSVDKDRSGYVLFRLDTQSAAGEWEFICLAYQPDGAKIREKMNYVPVRTSLLSTLGEHNFLATEFGSAPTEFQYPTKLRNARKHDYQNPQLRTAGKKPSEAAGTDAGGARRNFGAVNLAAAGTGKRELGEEKRIDDEKVQLPPTSATADVSKTPTTLASSDDSERPSTSFSEEVKTQEPPAPAPIQEIEEASPAPEEAQESRPDENEQAEEKVASIVDEASKYEKDRGKTEEEKEEEEVEETNQVSNIEDEDEKFGASTSQSIDPVSHSQSTQEEAESRAPEEPPTPAMVGNLTSASFGQSSEEISEDEHQAEEAANQMSQPTLPEDSKLEEVAEEVAHSRLEETASTSIPKTVVDPVQEQVDPPSIIAMSNPAPITSNISSHSSSTSEKPSQSSSTVGMGTSDKSILSPSEQSLATLKATEAASLMSSSSSNSSNGSSSLGFQWSEEVSPALAGLRTHVSGSAEWNYVSISIDLKDETITLSEPPRFLPLGEISTTVDSKEPRYIFYRMESSFLESLNLLDLDSIEQVSKGQQPVIFIYSCPSESSVKNRMLYSANRNTLLARIAKEFSKVWIATKIETSDPASDLTSSSIKSDLEHSIKALISKSQAEKAAITGAGAGAGNSNPSFHKVSDATKGFSRPRRPGAK